MAKKVWDGPISKNTDWGGDASTENLPVSGGSIQEWIKENFDNRIGILHYDNTNNRYLAFADQDTLDQYLENPTLTDLILGTFDAPFNYEASIILTSPTYKAVPVGSTGHYIDFTFDIKNKSGQSTGEDVVCTYTIIKGSTKRVLKEKYRAGTSVHFNIDDYITEGTNRITVGIVGQNTLAATTIGITYQVVNLTIEDTMDISTVYNLLSNPQATVPVEYTVEGNGTKTMEWYLDGVLLDFVQVEDEIVDPNGSRTKYIPLEGLSNGKHSIQYRTSITIEGEKFYSNTLYRDVIVYDGSSVNPIIAIAAVIPSGYNPSEDGTLNLRGINQYEPFDIQLSVYNPSSAAATEAAIYLDNQLQATLTTHNGDVLTYSILSTSYGVKSLRIEAGVTTYEAQVNISQSSINLVEITENLQLDFRAANKSNSDADKDRWSYGSYNGTFTGFNWNETSGWTNKRLRIPGGASLSININPLSPDPVSTGKTLEFEFSTVNVSDDSTVLCDLRNSSGVGILITASKVSLTSAEGKELITEYKSEENIRIAFVINKRSGSVNKGMAFVYVNGIVSGSVNFSTTDLFTSTTQFYIQGSDEATVLLKDLRFYNSALSSDQILNNYILYRDTAYEMVRVYDRNDVYEEGTVKFSLDALNAQLPVMVFTGNIPELEATSDKDYTIDVDIEYTNLQDPSLNFTMKNGKLRLQGTSSLGYPKKNYRFYSNKSDATVFLDSDGMALPNRKYSFKKGAQPVDCWCLKADFAESSGTHNTGIARLWGDVLPNVILDGEYVCRTNAQKAALEAGYPYDVRTTIDGFPIIVAYRLKAEDDPILIGKYNFNNDKSTESVFGFCDIPGFDDSKVQCWEVLNNGDQLALFQTTENWDTIIDSASGKKRWEQAYEARYPDKNTDTTYLKAFCDWVVSTKDNVAKFKTEKWQHCNVYMMAAYYVYAIRHGAVDQIVKNSMLTTEDGEHFFWILYDNDTINGLRNDGRLKYPPTIDRQSLDADFTETVYAYAGHDSVLWNNMEADDEFMNIVIRIDNALYSAGLTYNNVINMFDVEQSSKWCERIYNLDAQYKYIGPFTDQGLNYLELLQGSRQSHRRWWLSRRFNLIDSKFVSGEYKAKGVELKLVGCPANTQFKLTAGYDMNYGYGINNDPIEYGISLNEGESHNFSTPNRVLNIGDPLNIYAAINIQELDFSNFTPYMSQINIGSVYSETLGTKLKKLILGVDISSDTRRNTSVGDVSGLPSAKRLEYLDIGGYEGIESLNLSGNAFLTTLKAYGSGLTGVTFAEGGAISSVQLPETMQALVLKNLPYLSTSGLNIAENGKNLRVITIQNCAKLRSTANFIFDWYDNKVSKDAETSLTLTNIIWANIDVEKLIALGNIKFAGGTLSLKGKIYLTSCSEEQANRLVEIFGTKAFDKENELYISAPDAIYLTGPDEVIAGEKAQFYATVFSEYKGTVTYSISGSYVSIDQKGLVTSRKFAGGSYTCTVTAKHTPTEGKIVTVTKTFTLKGLVTVSGLSITGDSTIGAETKDYKLIINPSSGVTASYNITWSLSGEAFNQGLVEIISQSNSSCTLRGKAGTSTLKCTLSVSSKDEFGSTKSASKSITVYEEGLLLTIEEAPKVLNALYNAGFINSNAKLYDYEAASITCLKNALAGVEVESLDWISYTSITEIGAWDATSAPEASSLRASLSKGLASEELILPNTVTKVDLTRLPVDGRSSGIEEKILTRIYIPSSVISISGYFEGRGFVSEDIGEFKLEIDEGNPNYRINHGIIVDKNTGLFISFNNLGGYANNDSYWADKDIYLPEGTTDTLPEGAPSHRKYAQISCKRFVLPSTITYMGNKALKIRADELVIHPNIPVSACYTGSYYGGWLYESTIRKIVIPGTWEDLPIWLINFNSSYVTTLEEVIVSEGVKTISGMLIGANNNKISVDSNFKLVLPSTVTSLGIDILYIQLKSGTTDLPNFHTFELPENLNTIYGTSFSSITKYIKEFKISSNNEHFSVVDGLLLSKSGETLISFPAGKDILENTLNIPESVTRLESTCFTGISLSNLNINFPSNLLEIGDNVLDGYKYLDKLPDTIVSMGKGAFKNLDHIIELPRDLETLGDSAFQGYLENESVVWNSKLKTIGENLFYRAQNLYTLKLPASLENLGNSFLYENSNLRYVEFPKNLLNISTGLDYCGLLDTIVFLNNSFVKNLPYNFGSRAGTLNKLKGINRVYMPNYTVSNFEKNFSKLVENGFVLGSAFLRLAIIQNNEWVLNKVVTVLGVQGIQQADGYYYFQGFELDENISGKVPIYVDGSEIGSMPLLVGKDNMFIDEESQEITLEEYNLLDEEVCNQYISDYLPDVPEGFSSIKFRNNSGLDITSKGTENVEYTLNIVPRDVDLDMVVSSSSTSHYTSSYIEDSTGRSIDVKSFINKPIIGLRGPVYFKAKRTSTEYMPYIGISNLKIYPKRYPNLPDDFTPLTPTTEI